MSYRVLAPLVLVKVPRSGDGDRIDYHYAGSIIPWLSAEQAKQFLGEGLVVDLGDNAPSAVAEEPAPPAPAGDAKPPQIATEDALRAWLLAPGRDTKHTPEEIAKMSRDDLRALADAL